jgi:hypothetical protein
MSDYPTSARVWKLVGLVLKKRQPGNCARGLGAHDAIGGHKPISKRRGTNSMRAFTCSAALALMIGLCAGWAQSPPIDQQAIFPNSEDAMARALADPKIPPEVKAQLFALFTARLKPREIEDKAGNTWLYRQSQEPVIIKERKRLRSLREAPRYRPHWTRARMPRHGARI